MSTGRGAGSTGTSITSLGNCDGHDADTIRRAARTVMRMVPETPAALEVLTILGLVDEPPRTELPVGPRPVRAPEHPDHCTKCARPMVTRRKGERPPEGSVAHAAHGMCSSCYRPTKPRGQQESRSRRVHASNRCRDCALPMVARSKGVRLPEGGVFHGAWGRCVSCDREARRTGAAS